MSTTSIREKGCKPFATIETKVQRLKTQKSGMEDDKVVHFCHVDEISRCYFFAAAYAAIMDDSIEPSEHMFPKWKKLVKITEKGTESKVSGEFSDLWKKMASIASDYCVYLNKHDIGSMPMDDEEQHERSLEMLHSIASKQKSMHMCKKYAVQALGDSDLAPRVSYFMKIHVLFLIYYSNCYIIL